MWPSYALIVLLNRSYGNKMLFDVTLLCLFLCRTNPHIHEQGGDSAPTFYSSSKLRKSHFFTASPPLGGFGHFCPIAFLSTPAAHRSVQSWTHLPKIGEVCFLGQPNFGLSFSWRKNPLPVGGGKFRSLLSQDVFLKNRKNRRAIKTEFSVLTQDVRSFAHIYPHNLFHNFV